MPGPESPEGGQASHHILPVVTRTCSQVDEIFARYVGPIGAVLCQDSFALWSRDNKNLSAIGRYISLLAQYIPEIERRNTFIAEARRRVQQALGVTKGADASSQKPRFIDPGI